MENLIGREDRGLKLLSLRPVRDLMEQLADPAVPVPDADVVREDDSLRQALSLMLSGNLSRLAVCDETGRQTGVISRETVIREGV